MEISNSNNGSRGKAATSQFFTFSSLPEGVSFNVFRAERPYGPSTPEEKTAALKRLTEGYCDPSSTLYKCWIRTWLFRVFEDPFTRAYNHNHYVTVERFPDGREYYVVRFWKNTKDLEFIRLYEVDKENPPQFVRLMEYDDGYLVIDTGPSRAVRVSESHEYRIVDNVRIKKRVGLTIEFEPQDNDRFWKFGAHKLAVPVNDLSGDEPLQREYIRDVVRKTANVPGRHVLELSDTRRVEGTYGLVWSIDFKKRETGERKAAVEAKPGQGEISGLSSPARRRKHIELPTILPKDRIGAGEFKLPDENFFPTTPDIGFKLKPPRSDDMPPIPAPEEPDPGRGFSEMVVKKAAIGEDGQTPDSVDMIFALDISGSMQHARDILLENIGSIVDSFRARGVTRLGVAVVTFWDAGVGRPKTLFPLTAMDDDGVKRLADMLKNISFNGGEEPVGEAVMAGLDILKKSDTASRFVFVLTDRDGLQDDMNNFPYLSDGKMRAANEGVAIDVTLIPERTYSNTPVRNAPVRLTLDDIVSDMVRSEDYAALVGLATGKNIEESLTANAALDISRNEKARDAIREMIRKGNNPYFRLEAAKILIRWDDEFGMKTVLDIARSSDDWYAQQRAVNLLAKVPGGNMAIKKVAASANSDEIRLYAARGLIGLDKAAGLDALARIAGHSGDDFWRLSAAEELHDFGDARGLAVLRDLALNSSDYRIRKSAATTLVSMGDDAGTDAFRSMAFEKGGEMEEYATSVLLGMGEKVGEDTLERIARGTSDDPLRLKAAEMLLKTNGEKARKAYHDIARSALDPYARLDAINVLIDSGDAKALKALKELANEGIEDSNLLFEIADSLANVKDPQSLVLFHHIAAGTTEIRLGISALGRLIAAGSEGRRFVHDLASGASDPEILSRALEAMASGDNRNSIKALRKNAFNEEYDEDRLSAALALARLGDGRGLEATVDLALNSKEAGVRQKALAGLASLKGPGMEALKDVALGSNDAHTRFEAENALQEFGKDAIPFMREFILKTRDEDLRLDATKFLVRRREDGRDVIEELAFGAHDGEVRVRMARALALMADTSRKELRSLALSSDDPAVRESTADALEKIGDQWISFLSNEDLHAEARQIDDERAHEIVRYVVTIACSCNEDPFDVIRDNSYFRLYALSRFAPHVREYGALMRNYAPIIDGSSGNKTIIDLVARYSRDHTLAETIAYRDDLLVNADIVKIEAAGIEYHRTPRLKAGELGTAFYSEMGMEDGERELKQMAFSADREHKFLFVGMKCDGKNRDLWFEVPDDRKNDVLTALLQDENFEVTKAVGYKVCPLENSKANAGALAALVPPSDLGDAAKMSWLAMGSGHPVPLEFRFVTPSGMYRMTPQKSIADIQGIFVDGVIRNATDAYRSRLDDRIGKLIFEDETVGFLESTGLVTAEYVFDDPRLASLHKLYREWQVIRFEEILKVRGKMSKDEAVRLAETIARHHAEFSETIEHLKKAKIDSRLLPPYIKALNEEKLVLSSLSKVVGLHRP